MTLHFKKKSRGKYQKLFFFTITFFAFSVNSFCQPLAKLVVVKPYKPGAKDFVISYKIVVSGEKLNGIAETYNGGLKTTFIKGDLARVRLVSLMRTQSIFYNNKKGLTRKVAAVVKESGKEKTNMFLNAKQWKLYNSKNDSVSCSIFKNDTLRILNLLCAKAIITNKDSTKLVVYFYPCLKNKTFVAAEPLFACIPGLVMKYTFTKFNKSIEYTANSLKANNLSNSIFTIPNIGYTKLKYNPNGLATTTVMGADEEDEEGTEEEDTEMPAKVVIPTITPVTNPK